MSYDIACFLSIIPIGPSSNRSLTHPNSPLPFHSGHTKLNSDLSSIILNILLLPWGLRGQHCESAHSSTKIGF